MEEDNDLLTSLLAIIFVVMIIYYGFSAVIYVIQPLGMMFVVLVIGFIIIGFIQGFLKGR